MGKTYLIMKGAAGRNGRLLTGSDLMFGWLDALVPSAPSGIPIIKYKDANYMRVGGVWVDEEQEAVEADFNKFLEMKYGVGEYSLIVQGPPNAD